MKERDANGRETAGKSGFTFVEGPLVTIPLADYLLLAGLIEHDDMFVVCAVCGAWLHRDDPATCSVDDFSGCWKVASDRPKDQSLCRSYRATVAEFPSPPNQEGETR